MLYRWYRYDMQLLYTARHEIKGTDKNRTEKLVGSFSLLLCID